MPRRNWPTREEANRGREHVAELRSKIRTPPRCPRCVAHLHDRCQGYVNGEMCSCDCTEGSDARERPTWSSPLIRRFRKRPVEVDAVRYDGTTESVLAVRELAATSEDTVKVYDGYLVIPTLEGPMRANPGWWIVRGTRGELYPCRSDPFADSFDPVEGP